MVTLPIDGSALVKELQSRFIGGMMSFAVQYPVRQPNRESIVLGLITAIELDGEGCVQVQSLWRQFDADGLGIEEVLNLGGPFEKSLGKFHLMPGLQVVDGESLVLRWEDGTARKSLTFSRESLILKGKGQVAPTIVFVGATELDDDRRAKLNSLLSEAARLCERG